MQYRIIDNSNEKNSLLHRLKSYLKNSKKIKVASGYFFIKGFNELIEDLKNLEEIKLLIGNTTNRQTIEEIALGYRYYSDIEEEVKKAQRKLNIRAKTPLLSDTKNDIKFSIETTDVTDENEHAIRRLADFIGEKKLKVKVYLKSKLHSKAYILDYKKELYDENGNKIERVENGISIVGSSNFTLAGLTHNTELNVLVEGNDEHLYLTEWFNSLWDESEEFSEELFNELNRSWAVNYPTPYEVYLKILYHLVKDRIEDSEELLLEDSDIFIDLTTFQKRAVAQAINILGRYCGVFISDVVGLGKSYIGSALLDYYHKRGKRALIICPPRLESMWRSYNNYYDLGAEIESIGVVSLNEGYEKLLKYSDKEIVLIDESHNFRNNENNRYRNLTEFLLPYNKKIILLSATPLNNTPYDVYNQIKLFHHEDETPLPIMPANIKQFIDSVLEGKTNLQTLLQHILIRRTRAHIKKYYPNERINGKPLVFPKRNLPEPILYSIESVYENMYDEILEYLLDLTYARYNLFDYVKAEFIDKNPYTELQSAGKNLRGFIKVLLLKRLESSVAAFRDTINNLSKVHDNYIQALKELKILPIGDEAQELIYSTDNILDFTSELEKIVEKSEEKYDLKAFDVERLLADLNNDLEIFKSIGEIVKNITPDKDDKLVKFKEILGEIRKKYKKILVFSQFKDTTRYLNKNLKGIYKEELEEVSSLSTDIFTVVRRFSPESNNAEEKEKNNPINILISTDVLSEGQNLQDCNVVVNYDIHWNPVKLIQRVGRVDRIGSEYEEIDIYNFFPEAKLEENLRIEERVTKRIQEIHNVFGEDGKYLSDNEILNTNDMYAIYDQRDENILNEEEFIINDAEEIIRNLQKENPSLFEKIKNMPDNVRCVRKSKKEGYVVFCKHANNYSFYITDKEGNILSQNDDEALDLVKSMPTEIGLEKLPENANRVINNTFNVFKEKMKRIRLEREKRLTSRTREQDFVLKSLKYELDNLNALSDDYEKKKSRLNELYDIYSNILATGVNRKLRLLRKNKVSGKELEKELIRIKNDFNLTKERKLDLEKKEEVPKIICSQIFVSKNSL